MSSVGISDSPAFLRTSHRPCPDKTRSTGDGIALFALEQAGPPLAETDLPDIEECGETVKRTGKPCLLRRGHSGRHRSVL